MGRVRPLLVGSWVLVEASSGHRGKPRLPVSLSPPYRHRPPLQKLRICEIGREDFLPRKIRFLWSTNLIFRKFWAKKKNQHWGALCTVRAQGVSEKVSVTSSEKNWAAGGVIFAHFPPNPNTKEDSLVVETHVTPSQPPCCETESEGRRNFVKAFCLFFRPHTHTHRCSC